MTNIKIEILKENKKFKITKHSWSILRTPIYFYYLFDKTEYIKVKEYLNNTRYAIQKIDFSHNKHILFIYKLGDKTKRIKYLNNNWQIGIEKVRILEDYYKNKKK